MPSGLVIQVFWTTQTWTWRHHPPSPPTTAMPRGQAPTSTLSYFSMTMNIHSSGRVSLIGGQLFYSPNCPDTWMAPLPYILNQYIFCKSCVCLEDFTRLNWWTEPYGWLGFLLLRLSFHEVPFNCLNVFLLIQEGLGGYHLNLDMTESWQRLENKLIWSMSFMTRTFPVAALCPPPLLIFGYTGIYKTIQGVLASKFLLQGTGL